MLSDTDINNFVERGELKISPFTKSQLRPSSYLLTLSTTVGILSESLAPVELSEKSSYPDFNETEIGSDGFILQPNDFVLASTVEKIGLGRKVGAILRNRTGLSRLGLSAEISSLISPGFGEIEPYPLTLELKNFSKSPILIKPGLEICHCVFFQLLSPSTSGYDIDVGAHSLKVSPAGSRFFASGAK